MLNYINLPEKLLDILLISASIVGLGIFLYSYFSRSRCFLTAVIFLIAVLGITLIGLQLIDDVAIRHPQWIAKFLLSTLLGLPIWISLALAFRHWKQNRSTVQFKPHWFSAVSFLTVNLYSILYFALFVREGSS